jgi:hypothetical protein
MKLLSSLFKTSLLTAVVLGSQSVGFSQPQSVAIDTSVPSRWAVSGGGAVGVTPYHSAAWPAYLYITSNDDSTGSFLPGGSYANFHGFWKADFTFSLPSSATNVRLDFANFHGDDRAVLTLNGNALAATGVDGPGQGYMVLTDGGALQPYTFDNLTSGSATSGFNLGGVNTIEIIVNNTGNGISAPNQGFAYSGDYTYVGLTGTISYTLVPEPSAAILVSVGSLLFGFWRIGRRNG